MTQDVGYSANASFWVKIMRERLDRYRNELTDPAVLSALGHADRLRILDAGCGEGYLSRLLAGHGAIVTGIDLDPELIQAAQELEATEQQSIEFANTLPARIPIRLSPASGWRSSAQHPLPQASPPVGSLVPDGGWRRLR
jgi:ribosomal protein L11 methylase PrmA